MAEKYAGFDKLNSSDRGKLKHLMNKLGPDTAKVVQHTINHWDRFVWNVKLNKGAGNGPGKPTIGYLLAYADVAVNHLHDGQQEVMGHVVAPPIGPRPITVHKPKLVEDEEVPASKEVVEALMREHGLL